MNADDTTRKTAGHDWSRADVMTESDVHAAALSDPDAQPLTEEGVARMRLVPRTKTMRRALGLTQEGVCCTLQDTTRHATRLGTRAC